MAEFTTKFERLAGVMKGLDEQFFMRIFSNGLRKEIRVELKLHKGKSLSGMMNKAHVIKEKNIAIAKVATFLLTHDEIQEKVKKGECFCYDEKYGPNHVYRNKQLNYYRFTTQKSLKVWSSLKGCKVVVLIDCGVM
ncbi:hypothetical protein CR513_55248, partial [Mucuna pruriens]